MAIIGGKVGIGTVSPDKLLHLGDDYYNINGEIRFEASNGEEVDLGITTNDELYITGGNVGIGTTDPDKLLHVGDDFYNLNGELRFEASDGDYVDLGITTSDQFYITGGNIGIGTTSPDTELHVNGDIKQKVTTSDVSNPPTDGELDILFGTPASNGDGWTAYLKDSDQDYLYQIVTKGTEWYIFTAELAT
jgi:hypothetical protein